MAFRITGRVIERKSRDRQGRSIVNTHQLNGRILEREARDRRRRQGMGVEELGLRHASVRALSIPPSRSVTVND